MVPVGRLVVLRTTEKHNLIDSIAYITWPGTGRARRGSAGGRLHHHLRVLALDFFPECAARHHRNHALALRIIPNAKRRTVSLLIGLGFAAVRSACMSFMYGLELVGCESAPVEPTVAYLIARMRPGRVLAVLHLRARPAPLIESRSAENQNVCDHHCGRIALSHRHQRVPVPAAADVSGRLRAERVSVGPC